MESPKNDRLPQSVQLVSEIPTAKVTLSGDSRLVIDFRIQDLVKRLVPGGGATTSCGGCNGCMGCSM